MPPLRLVVSLVIATLASAVSAARASDDSCQKAYVIPYAEQCSFAYKTLHKDTSPGNLSAAFNACGRAQNVAVSCVKSPNRQLHAVALGALYQDVTQQAEIALFAQQFGVARALLQERMQILDVVAHDGKPGDEVARERSQTKIDLADASAGLCTQGALASAGDSRRLAHDKKYGDLANYLRGKAGEYAACALKAPTLSTRAYLEYVGFVALEESARAAQAAGRTDDANAGYRSCIAGARHASGYAKSPVKSYLTTIGELCTGRMNGAYAVDQPAPIDAPEPKGFRPLTLPKR